MSDHSVILFDGVCNLCNGVVKFVIRRDPQSKFRFAALQSVAGQELLKKYDLSLTNFDTFILIESNHPYNKSTAALRVLKALGGGWMICYILIVIPRPIRDWMYGILAQNRYRWFGKQESCLMPTADVQKRFLLP